jgi:hypothetical protein
LFIYLPVKPPSDFFIIFGKRHEVWFWIFFIWFWYFTKSFSSLLEEFFFSSVPRSFTKSFSSLLEEKKIHLYFSFNFEIFLLKIRKWNIFALKYFLKIIN